MGNFATDPISPWFHIAEEEGEFIGIRFGRLPPGSNEPEWKFLRHIDFDGVGGFGELLRRSGADLPRLPQIKHPAPPSRLALVKSLPKFLKPRRRVQWSPLERGAQVPSSKLQPPLAVAWHIFDEAETTQIRRVCRKNGFTVNSFLLKHLTKAIRPSLKDESSVVPWMIPVNLRGKVCRDRDTANFTSYISARISSYETVFDIHRNIYAALGRSEHWANWYAYELGRLASKGMKKQLLKRDLAMAQWNIGSFSNLGDWDPEKNITQTECEGAWLFAPPVLRCQMLGAGCVTFQNCLSLTLQAHPDLTCSPAVPAGWVQNWVKEIDLDVTSMLADPPRRQWLAA
ncbi:MAG TPA: hypothetical protein VFE51_13710 [Verrucomicrobiae bacterium]|nr:hypothetical protein [Verrucomicrobiae bacterium]